MKQYNVSLTSEAIVKGSVTVEANSEEEAKAKAVELASQGGIVWEYDGVLDGTVEVDRIFGARLASFYD